MLDRGLEKHIFAGVVLGLLFVFELALQDCIFIAILVLRAE